MMKKMMIAAALCSMTLSSCILEKRAQRGDEVTRNERVEQFDKIQLSGGFKVRYTQGDSCTVQLKGWQRDIDRLTCEVRDGVLVVEMPVFTKNSKVELVVGSRMLSEVRVEGACDFEAERGVKVRNLSFMVDGACDIDIDDLTCDTLQMDINGAGDVDVDVSRAQQTKVSIDGAGDVDLVLKDCGNVDCSIAGAGEIELRGNVRSLSKRIDGIGKIDTDRLVVGQ